MEKLNYSVGNKTKNADFDENCAIVCCMCVLNEKNKSVGVSF